MRIDVILVRATKSLTNVHLQQPAEAYKHKFLESMSMITLLERVVAATHSDKREYFLSFEKSWFTGGIAPNTL